MSVPLLRTITGLAIPASTGIAIAAGIPGVTTNFLYQVGGTLYFNGGALVTGTPFGATTQIQYNNAGVWGSSANFTFDAATNTLALGGTNPTLTITARTTEPTPPATGNLTIYAKSVAGRMALKWVGPAGIDSMAQPHIGQDKIVWSTALGNAVTVPQQWGMPVWTAVGTATARNFAVTNVLTRQKRLGYATTAATAGLLCQIYSTIAQNILGNGAGLGGFIAIFRFGVSDAAAVATARMFVGMSTSIAAATNVEPSTLLNCVGVAKLAASANLQIVYGGSAAQTAIDLGVNFPANTLSADSYELVLFAPSNTTNTIGYKVSRLGTAYVAEGLLTAAVAGTQLPSAAMAPRIWRTNNTTAVACAFDFVQYYCGTDY